VLKVGTTSKSAVFVVSAVSLLVLGDAEAVSLAVLKDAADY